MKLFLQYGPALLVFLTILLSMVITSAAVQYLVIPLLVLFALAILCRYLFGPFR